MEPVQARSQAGSCWGQPCLSIAAPPQSPLFSASYLHMRSIFLGLQTTHDACCYCCYCCYAGNILVATQAAVGVCSKRHGRVAKRLQAELPQQPRSAVMIHNEIPEHQRGATAALLRLQWEASVLKPLVFLLPIVSLSHPILALSRIDLEPKFTGS